jgi:hypothetical protein
MVKHRASGANLPSGWEREPHDWYREPPRIVDALLDVEEFHGTVLDPCCGGGTIPARCLARGIHAIGSDIVDRGYGIVQDVFDRMEPVDAIVTNPPYKLAVPVAQHALCLASKVALLLRINFLEGQSRKKFFKDAPLARIWVSAWRASMPPGCMNGPRDEFGALVVPPATGGTTTYAWFIFVRGHNDWPEVRWLELEDAQTAARPLSIGLAP